MLSRWPCSYLQISFRSLSLKGVIELDTTYRQDVRVLVKGEILPTWNILESKRI